MFFLLYKIFLVFDTGGIIVKALLRRLHKLIITQNIHFCNSFSEFYLLTFSFILLLCKIVRNTTVYLQYKTF